MACPCLGFVHHGQSGDIVCPPRQLEVDGLRCIKAWAYTTAVGGSSGCEIHPESRLLFRASREQSILPLL